jgi:seryl-tRNA synthetase
MENEKSNDIKREDTESPSGKLDREERLELKLKRDKRKNELEVLQDIQKENGKKYQEDKKIVDDRIEELIREIRNTEKEQDEMDGYSGT